MAVLKYKKNGIWYEVGGLSVNEQEKLNTLIEQQTEEVCDALSVPVLAKEDEWFKRNDNQVKKDQITKIIIEDRHNNEDGEISWNADENDIGAIICYYSENVLYICCNRAGGLALNANSYSAFADFKNCTEIIGQALMKMDRVRRAYGLFANSGFTHLGDDSWNFRRAYNMLQAFMLCESVTSINLGMSTLRHANNVKQMFSNCVALEQVIAPKLAIENATNASMMFYKCNSLRELDMHNCTFTLCTDMSDMFSQCQSLTRLDATGWRLQNCTTASSMFAAISQSSPLTGMKIREIVGVGNWGMSACVDFSHMFYGCHYLTDLDLSLWDVSNGENYSHMFADTSGMETLIFDDGQGNAWNPTAANSFNAMFNDCGADTLDISCFKASKAKCLSQMFERFTGKIIGYETLNTSETTEFGQMFMGVTEEVLDLSGYDTRKASGTIQSGDTQGGAGMYDMFTSANYLREIRLGINFDIRGDGTMTTAQAFKLPTPSSEYIDGADGYWYEADGTKYEPDSPPNPAELGRAITLYAVNPTTSNT